MANELELQEMAAIPDKYRPLGMWAFFGYSILFSIPIVGFICVLVFSFSNTNICRRNFARSYFCLLIITVVAIIVLSAMGISLGNYSSVSTY